MTVSSSTNKVLFLGNGVTTQFSLPFRFFADEHINAYFIESATNNITKLTLGIDYTLIGSGEPEVDGSAVSFLITTAPVASGRGLFVERVMPLVQETDIVNQGEFFASTHENVFDWLTMLIQQADGKASDSMRLADNRVTWDARGLRISNVGSPVEQQDAVTQGSMQAYVGGILNDFTGDINVASNVAYFGTDGVTLFSMQDLSNKTDQAKGAALVGRSVVVVQGIQDLLSPALAGRTDIVVHVQRYWRGSPTSNVGGGWFQWLNNPKSSHDGGVRISPTVPWNGTQGTHANFLNGVGETDPAGSGYWVRVASTRTQGRSPIDYGANTVSIVPDSKYIFDKFETQFPGAEANLDSLQFRVSSFPSGAKYYNGSFRRISDAKVIEPGWSGAVRVGNRNALVGRNTAINLTTNNHEQTSGQGYNLTALGDGALYSAGNSVKHQTAIGPNAGYSQQYGRYNIYIGLEAGYACTGDSGDEDIGSRNVAVGDNAMRFNQGYQNNAMGRNSLQVNVNGNYNTALGSASCTGTGPVGLDGVTIKNPFPTNGSYKTAVGAITMTWAYADYIVGVGSQALENLKGGIQNVAVGGRALRLLESGYAPNGNLIRTSGAGAKTWTRSGTTLTVNSTGHANVAGDVVALTFTSGVPSNVIGVTQYLTVATAATNSFTVTLTSAEAAAMSTSGNATEVEAYYGAVQTTQDNNTALGHAAGQALLLGTENVFVGQAAAFNLTGGAQNTAIGRSALRSMQSGANATNLNNCTGIGYDTRVSGDNQVQLGNSLTTTYVYGTVQNRSDRRDKADIRDTSLGIDFVLGLRPVEGRWNMREDYRKGDKPGSKKRKRLHQWFIAQEVAELCERLGVEFGGLQHHAVNGGDDVYSLGYDEFIPPVVCAIQAIHAKIEDIETRLAAIEQQ